MINRLPDVTLKTEKGLTSEHCALPEGADRPLKVSEAARLPSITKTAGVAQHVKSKSNAAFVFFQSQYRIPGLETSQGQFCGSTERLLKTLPQGVDPVCSL